MKKYFLLFLVLLPAIVLGAVTPNVTNLASFSKEQLIKVIECMVKPESAGSLKFCLEQIGGPVITSYNQTLDINGTIDIKGKNFGTKVRVELAVVQGQGEGVSNYRKAIDLNTTLAGTVVTVPLSKLITTDKDKAMFVGNYNTMLNVTRLSDGVVASAGYINITEDLVADKVVIGEGAKLTKTLVNGKETLVGTFSITLRSEKKSATTIPKSDPFGVVAYNPLPKAGTPFYMPDGPHDTFSKNTYVKTAGEAVDYGNYYIIPEGKSATFRVTATFDPLQMFGGNYVAKVRNITYGDSVGKWAVQVLPEKTPRNKTNTVVVVGEKSPYITFVSPSGKETPAAEWNGVVTISGLRFDRSDTLNFAKYQSGGNYLPVKQLPVPTSTTATKITLETSKLGLEVGQYVVTVTNKNNGTSNQSDSFFVKSATTTPPVTATTSIKVISPNGGESYFLNQNLTVSWDKSKCFSTNVRVAFQPKTQPINAQQIYFSHVWDKPNSGSSVILLANNIGLQPDQYKVRVVCDPTADIYYYGVYDDSDAYFTIASSSGSTTTASSLTLEKVSTSVSQELGSDTTTSDDRGLYDFTFKVTPIGGYTYIPLTALRSHLTGTSTKGVLFWMENESDNITFEGQADATLSSVSGGVISGNYLKIEEGESATFRLSASFDPASTTAYYKLQLWALNYGGTQTAPSKTAFFLPQKNFETSVVEVKASTGTQSRNTASVWEAIKSFFK